MSYTAGSVMDTAAALLNDTAKALYSYTVQIPYLKIANRDLEQELQLTENQIDVISEAEIVVSANAISLALPTSFFLPIKLMEKASGDTFYSPMYEKPDVNLLNITPGQTLSVWDFRHNCINFIGATEDRTVRLEYWRTLSEIVDQNSNEQFSGAQNYLAFRTAALCAEFIAKDKGRADSLNLQGGAALDRIVSLFVKNNQGKRVRRKPFRRNPPYLLVR
jgi:hypothetical protein